MRLTKKQKMNKNKLAVIGLGYVGLPLAAEFAKQYAVTGYDINPQRVQDIQSGYDETLEVNHQQLKQVLKNNLNGVYPCTVSPACRQIA